MSSVEQLSLLKDLGAFWYNDSSVPQLFERSILDSFISKNLAKMPSQKALEQMCTSCEAIFESSNTVKKESETCSKIIEPLLYQLGYAEKRRSNDVWLFDEQRTLREDDQIYIPDYCLFGSISEQELANKSEDSNYYSHVKVVLEAKRIGKDLLAKDNFNGKLDDRGKDALVDLSPLSQIRKYIRVSKSEFGIVTNGNDWILVSKGARNYLSTYHIRLSELVQLARATNDYTLLLYWWLPFSKYFLVSDNSNVALGLKEETNHFTNSLETDLKFRLSPVVVDLLNEVANVVVDKRELALHKEALILDAVRFIYQILYIGCLEDRNLLPVNNPVYLYRYSLRELFKLIADEKAWEKTGNKSFQIYSQLSNLITIVSSGCKELGVKNAVGEISFDQAQFSIPKALRIPDKPLRSIILKILETTVDSKQMVSLRALDTIQFGNIYEHILRLEISFNQKTGKFKIDTSEDSKFERSTAVYTPHHIVELMVADLVAKTSIDSWASVENLKLIDPCFGSGHFLIELARQFSQKILDSLAPEQIPLKDFKTCSVSERRQLIQRYLLVTCIYGVDRGEACIDVAKFAIWLSTAMIGQPPLYLDLQLRIGSSLYGDTSLEGLPSSDLKIIREVAKIRNQVRASFLSDGGGGKFKKVVSSSIDKIESVQEDLSDQFSAKRFGYPLDFDKCNEIAFRQRSFFWLREFPEVFLEGGFSGYITNPPYDQVKTSPSTLKFKNGESELYRLAKMTDSDISDYTELFECDPGYAPFQDGFKNLFEGFILLRNRIVRKSGLFSLIVPNSILAGEQTALVRRNLWSEAIHIVREYPEKDSVNKRVFRTRKVACAIIFGERTPSRADKLVSFELYSNANVEIPDQTDSISRSTSSVVDAANMPLVMLDKWQKSLAEGIAGFWHTNLNQSDIREGELNESHNKSSVFTAQKSGAVNIYGTNRMDFFGFNFFPKQDIVQFCLVSDSNITSAKMEDYKRSRVAINGIAGTNDSRVLCAAYLPPETLVNSNVNYVRADRLAAHNIDVNLYISFLNSIVYDKIIRVKKRTNHNSSALIATLPIPSSEGPKMVDMDHIRKKTVWKLNELRVISEKKLKLSTEFSLWLSESAKSLQELLLYRNEIVLHLHSTLTSITHLSMDEENSLARKLNLGQFDVEKFLLENEVRGIAAKNLKRETNLELDKVRLILELEISLQASLDLNFAHAVLGDLEMAYQLLGSYGVARNLLPNSLYNIDTKLAAVDTQEHHEVRRWSQVTA